MISSKVKIIVSVIIGCFIILCLFCLTAVNTIGDVFDTEKLQSVADESGLFSQFGISLPWVHVLLYLQEHKGTITAVCLIFIFALFIATLFLNLRAKKR